MADISQELSAIKNSVYGKNMRTAIHDAIKKVNEDGGGGGSGGGMSITTLWSNESGSTVGTEYTMSDDINNYDMLYFKCGNTRDVGLSQAYIQTSVLTSLINSGDDVSLECFYFQRNMHMSFNGDKFTVTSSGSPNEPDDYAPKVYQIVGVKF